MTRPFQTLSHLVLVQFIRDRRHQHIYSEASEDDVTFSSELEATSLLNNNAAIQATVLSSGNIAIVYHPTTSSRNPISISLSEDSGKTWRYTRNPEFEEGEAETKVEFSYPSILQSADGNIHVSYMYNRDTIKYTKLTEEWIKMKSECQET